MLSVLPLSTTNAARLHFSQGAKSEGRSLQADEITKVFLLFKTHLDVEFTDLSSVVTDRYMYEFIPKALAVGERLAWTATWTSCNYSGRERNGVT